MKTFSFFIGVVSINLVKGFMNPVFHKNWALVNDDNCGLQPALPGGLDAEIDNTTRNAKLGEYPWVVLIYLWNSPTGEPKKCMGTIISKRYILTASSCFAIYGNATSIHENIQVVAGESDTFQDHDCDESNRSNCAPFTNSYKVTKVLFFNKNLLAVNGMNIALIQTAENIEFHDYTVPICLERGELLFKVYEGELGVKVTGWGVNTYDRRKVESKHKYDSILQHAPVRLFKQDENYIVYDFLPDSFQQNELNSVSYFGVKATGEESFHDADIGGPLMVKKQLTDQDRPRFYLYGIMSFQVTTSLPELVKRDIHIYSICTKVRYYMKWIMDNTIIA
ncbi:hypothetical protein LSTR_LSTR006761 [Laodelphax striatellus]|uniref:Peptidase S1 domain-containing protein n=1 Tax=Laodelphax striatellus TaxID=195883 RepID=A0A482XE03_LAOST|nr:hypothetical protein LSTR_LSTR006761 [Laodelphax striatellus]